MVCEKLGVLLQHNNFHIDELWLAVYCFRLEKSTINHAYKSFMT